MPNEQLIKTMEERGYIYLGENSWFRFIQRSWWDRFTPLLIKQKGEWIPRYDKIQELGKLTAEHKAYEDNLAYEETRRRRMKAQSSSVTDGIGYQV